LKIDGAEDSGEQIMSYIHRGAEEKLLTAIQGFPAVMLHGARQTGKTTLLRERLGKSYRYVSLEPPPIRQLAKEDPAGFLDLYRAPVIYDEIQHAPDLLPFIKERIDADRGTMGQYILTGSQNMLMMEQVSESLAGRTAVLQLYPLSQREIHGAPMRLLPWVNPSELHEMTPDAYAKRVAFCEQLLTGGYPDVVLGNARHRALWFDSYVQTYLERDVRQLRQVGDLGQFQNFLKAIAFRNGQLFNMSDVARDLGLAVNTVKAWLSVLEASGLILILRPYSINGGKRLVKTPKVYIADSGLLCHLAGIQTAEQLALSPLGGGVMEAAVLLEIRAAGSFHDRRPDLYFWRTSNGTEVDIVFDDGHQLTPIEVKLTGTPKVNMTRGIQSFRDAYGERSGTGWVVYSGDMLLPLRNGNIALPFTML
jgi:predicted AAA+ superfamily ATPase